MGANRYEQRDRGPGEDAPILALETLRNAGMPPALASKPSSEEQVPVFWRIFGATLLSIAALIAVTLYQQLYSDQGSLRNEFRALSDNLGDLVKKEEHSRDRLAVSASIKDVQASSAAAQELWRERALALERQIKASDEQARQQLKELTRELQHLRERLAVVESVHARPGASSVPKR